MSVPDIFTSSYHEHDPRWTAVDAYTQSHLHPPTAPSHSTLIAALENSRAAGLPDIASQPTLAKFFALQCRLGAVEHALEVGCLGGYTSIWLATQNPGLRVTTLEVDEMRAEVARQNLRHAGVEGQVEVLVGDAMVTMPRLVGEVERGERPPFGFVYVDADKENNWNYFDFAVRMGKRGTAIYVDNLVMRGTLVSKEVEEQDREDVEGARQVIEKVGKDERVDAVVMQTVSEKSYDGFMMACCR